VTVLAAARDAGVRRVLYPSSIAVYGQSLFNRALVDEDAPALPEGLYGVSKYAGECAALRLGALWNLDVVTGRIGNVFGPWEGETGLRDFVTPLAQIAACAARGREAVLPDTTLQRDLIYSRDLASALLALLDTPEGTTSVMNLSVMDDWSDIYRRWCRTLEPAVPGFRWRVAQQHMPGNIEYHDRRPRGRLDTGRQSAQLGFTPAFPPDRALADYADWLRSHGDYFAEAA
jgi:nucleoside-diphosphate-sugar epimerase